MLRLMLIVGTAIAAITYGFFCDSEGSCKVPAWVINAGKTCHSTYPYAIRHLSTKTPYIYKGGAQVLKPDGCTPEQVWMLVRHGTRNPSEAVITKMKVRLPQLRDEIINSHNDGKGSLCEKELSGLKSVKSEAESSLLESEEKYLVEQGKLELIGIANRFKFRFPDIFRQKYSNDTFKFQYTKTQRAEASANAFAITLFGEENHREVYYPPAVKAHPILRFYKACKKWQKEVDKNPEAYKEQRLFEKTEVFQSTLKAVSTRLGYDTVLDFKDVELMYLACSFETAWNPKQLSPWCAAFTQSDFKVMEYHQDIEYYWIDGYGYELTYKQACEPIKDIVKNFQNKISDQDGTPDLLAHFTHSGTCLKFLARLGLFQDEQPLRANNFEAHANRKWKTSQIDTFASNVAVVLYKCPSNEYKVGALFQEKEIALNACGGKLYCSFDEFQAGMKHITDDCDLDTLCRV